MIERPPQCGVSSTYQAIGNTQWMKRIPIRHVHPFGLHATYYNVCRTHVYVCGDALELIIWTTHSWNRE